MQAWVPLFDAEAHRNRQQQLIMPRAWLMVVQGSLSHRIELFGSELPWNDLTDAKRQLRSAADKMLYRGRWPHESSDRPRWANGAFVYLAAGEEWEIIQELEAWSARSEGNKLMSKHVLVSASLQATVLEVLEIGCRRSRRGGRLASQLLLEAPCRTFSLQEPLKDRRMNVLLDNVGLPHAAFPLERKRWPHPPWACTTGCSCWWHRRGTWASWDHERWRDESFEECRWRSMQPASAQSSWAD